jgi:hypothetical protein
MLGNKKGGTVLEERGMKDRARASTQDSAQQVVRSIQRLGDFIPGRARPMTRKMTTRSTQDQPTGWGTAAVIAAGALAGVIVGVATARRRH